LKEDKNNIYYSEKTLVCYSHRKIEIKIKNSVKVVFFYVVGEVLVYRLRDERDFTPHTPPDAPGLILKALSFDLIRLCLLSYRCCIAHFERFLFLILIVLTRFFSSA